GTDDPVAVYCEHFSQWVVEDRFPLGRPDFEHDGVEIVADVAPYETMKLRLLNGSHSLLAYAGLARGHRTVADAMADAELVAFVRTYLDEAAQSLGNETKIAPADYAAALLARFANDALEHSLVQIASDGSHKLPQRWLSGALENLDAGRPIQATAKAVAIWMHYVRGETADGQSYRVDDPLAARLADCHRQTATPSATVDALLSLDDVFSPRLAQNETFRAEVRRAYDRMTTSQ
ncbi:MAG: mannitol dehydrogenase family protein, partial [Gammaproteobacteria bacterium]|nr:mannitol dehydrogenase family protein [Gammaproteobacteria bacterium]